jgi:UDP-N-acetylglucosamine acyltransferase
MAATIHPTAIVEEGARLGEGVLVGPFCHVGPHVEIGVGARLHAHVVVTGRTMIGEGAEVFPFAVIGGPSQDLKAELAEGDLTIGAGCQAREHVTINSGIGPGTRIGERCVFLAGAHVAHDCRLGDGVVLSNQVLLGGHVEIDDGVMIGGGTAVHQFVRIGAFAFVGGLSGVEGDVIPFALASGNRAHLFGLNLVGLRRRGFDPERIARLSAVYRQLFDTDKDQVLSERINRLALSKTDNADIALILNFLRTPSQRPLCAPRSRGSVA